MKRIAALLISLVAIAVLAPAGTYIRTAAFLSTPLDVNAGITKVNGTEFTSAAVRVSQPGDPPIGALTVTFTRAAGGASTLDFEFQASVDGGTTWTSAYYVRIQVPTNETAVANVVTVTKELNLYGISHLRLYRIKNNDAANNTTACNAKVTL